MRGRHGGTTPTNQQPVGAVPRARPGCRGNRKDCNLDRRPIQFIRRHQCQQPVGAGSPIASSDTQRLKNPPPPGAYKAYLDQTKKMKSTVQNYE
jgi:hypothetical protein